MKNISNKSIDDLHNIDNISEQTKSLSETLLQSLENTDGDIDTNLMMVRASVVYLAANANNDNIDTNKLAEVSSTPSDTIREIAFDIIDQYSLPLSPPLESIVYMIATDLGIYHNDTFDFHQSVDTAEKINSITNRSPNVCAAAGIYITGLKTNAGVSQANIALKADTTAVSVRNALNDIRDQSDVDITIPNVNNGTEPSDVVSIIVDIHNDMDDINVSGDIEEIATELMDDCWNSYLSRWNPNMTAACFYLIIIEKYDDSNPHLIMSDVAEIVGLKETSVFNRYQKQTEKMEK